MLIDVGDSVEIGLWSIVETNTTVICVCVITIRPVLQYFFSTTLLHKIRSGWSRLKVTGLRGSSRNGIPLIEGPYDSAVGLHNPVPQTKGFAEDFDQSIQMQHLESIPLSHSQSNDYAA